MNQTGRQWAGQIIDGRFGLSVQLGASESACVYATEYEGGPAAIKLIRADRAQAKEHLLRWSRTIGLADPGIARLFETGRCQVGGMEFVFAVMERAEETLAEILVQRALTPIEVHHMLPSILGALAYLHGRGFAHSRLKPANILAVGDYVKISSDRICAIGAGENGSSESDGREAETRMCSVAADVWSVGLLITEALTQQVPQWSPSEPDGPVLPPLLPQPFLDIARDCLRRDPRQRSSIEDISARLQAPARSLARPAAQRESARSEEEAAQQTTASVEPSYERLSRPVTPRRVPPSWRHFVPAGALVALAVAVILVVPKILERLQNRESRSTVVEAGPSLVSAEKSEAPPTSKAKHADRSATAALEPTSSDAGAPKLSVSDSQSQVIQRVMPHVPENALQTISGTVRVEIRVQIAPSGDVSMASVESPGPSKYFANQALRAANEWKFAPAATGQGPRSSILRFEFRQDGTKVTPTPLSQ
jgi:TonB family protein